MEAKEMQRRAKAYPELVAVLRMLVNRTCRDQGLKIQNVGGFTEVGRACEVLRECGELGPFEPIGVGAEPEAT